MCCRHLTAVLLCLALVGCVYDVPLLPEPGLPLDERLLGTWEIPSEHAGDAAETVIVTRGEGETYVVEYHEADMVIHFRGWLGELEGIRIIQLEVTGDEAGQIGPDASDRFAVFSYEFDDDGLIARSLNTEYVPFDLTDSTALQQAFRVHRDAPDLFDEPGRLVRL